MTIDPYHFSEPLADDNLSDSQPKMQQNTDTIPKVLGRDHVPIGQPEAGRHQQIHLKNLTQLPPSINGFSGLYNLNGQLTYRDPNGNAIPLPLDLNTFNQGYVNIGGFIIQTGLFYLRKQRINIVNFPISFNAECRTIVMTPNKGGDSFPRIKLIRWTNKFFEADTDDNTNACWIAIGR